MRATTFDPDTAFRNLAEHHRPLAFSGLATLGLLVCACALAALLAVRWRSARAQGAGDGSSVRALAVRSGEA